MLNLSINYIKNLYIFKIPLNFSLNSKKNYFYLLNIFLNFNIVDISLISFLIIWNFEWFILVEYYLNYWGYSKWVFPYRIPKMLIIVFVYWVYVWSVSVWKRTQFGKFTRGDRKLWYKSFASFWVIEISTVVGIYAVILWLSWGPLPLLNRYFIIPKKSFLVELTLLTYLMWLAYLIRLTLKHQLKSVQYFLVLVILFIISYLLWRDLLILYMRDTVCIDKGSRWRYIKSTSVIYSLSNNWWTDHFLGSNKNLLTKYPSIHEFYSSNSSVDPFTEYTPQTEYSEYHWFNSALEFDKNYVTAEHNCNWVYASDFNWVYSLLNVDNSVVDFYYSRKTGFLPKRISMWYMLVVIKIWHHFMLYIWWFFYLFRIHIRQKNAYSILSVCYFNIYCCFLLSLIIYLFQVLPIFENFLRFKPYVRLWFQNKRIVKDALYYNYEIFTSSEKITTINIEFENLYLYLLELVVK